MQYMKLGFLIGVAFILANCSGNDPNQPPPPTATIYTDQGRYDAQALAQRTIATCCSTIAPTYQNVYSQASTGATAITVPPVNLAQCQQMMTELTLSLQTLYPTQGAAYYQPWLEAQAAALGNCVASSVPNNPAYYPYYCLAGAQMVQGSINTANASVSYKAYANMAYAGLSACGATGVPVTYSTVPAATVYPTAPLPTYPVYPKTTNPPAAPSPYVEPTLVSGTTPPPSATWPPPHQEPVLY